MGGWPKSSNLGSIGCRVPWCYTMYPWYPWCAMIHWSDLIHCAGKSFARGRCSSGQPGPRANETSDMDTDDTEFIQCMVTMVLLIFLLVPSSLFRPLDKFLCDAVLLSYVVVYCVFHASFSYSIFRIPLGLLVLALCWFVCLVLLFREHPPCQPKPQKSLNLSRFPSMRIHMGKVKKRVGMRALWHQ